MSTRLARVRALAFDPRATPPGWVGNAVKIKATVKIGEAVWPGSKFLAMDDLPDISNALGQKVEAILGPKHSEAIQDSSNRFVLMR